MLPETLLGPQHWCKRAEKILEDQSQSLFEIFL